MSKGTAPRMSVIIISSLVCLLISTSNLSFLGTEINGFVLDQFTTGDQQKDVLFTGSGSQIRYAFRIDWMSLR